MKLKLTLASLNEKIDGFIVASGAYERHYSACVDDDSPQRDFPHLNLVTVADDINRKPPSIICVPGNVEPHNSGIIRGLSLFHSFLYLPATILNNISAVSQLHDITFRELILLSKNQPTRYKFPPARALSRFEFQTTRVPAAFSYRRWNLLSL